MQKYGKSNFEENDNYDEEEIGITEAGLKHISPKKGQNSSKEPMTKKHSDVKSISNFQRADLGPLSDIGDIFEDEKSPQKRTSGGQKY